MAVIQHEDFIQSIADALQYISYYHPVDYIKALARADEQEESPAARAAMSQILIDSRPSAAARVAPTKKPRGARGAFRRSMTAPSASPPP
jgi:tartrate dehydratase alpha subunit/fumarate hydratase class I-like protein